MDELRRLVFLTLLTSLLVLLINPVALADLDVVETPPVDAGTVNVGETLTLTFKASYSGSTDSRAVISMGFNSTGWTYAGFTAAMGTIDVSADFTETISVESIDLTNDALEPDEETLTVSINFTATAEGNYTFDWSSAFSIISGANPDLTVAVGTTNVTIVTVTVTANAVWDEPTDTIDITATAECNICGAITSGTVAYEIFTSGDVSTGITGPMNYNVATSRWEALDVDTSTLTSGDYYALVNVTDPGGHSGTGQAPFTITRVLTYVVTISTSGLGSSVYTTHVFVDGVDQGTPYIWDGQSRDFVFIEGEAHTISVDQYVVDGAGARYYCEVNSWTTAPSGDQTHAFTYITQYLLTLSTNFGTVSASPTSVDGYYDAGTTVDITATPPSAIDGERYLWNGWTGTGTGSYTGPENPASVTMNSPIIETASWTHQYRLTVASEHGSPSPPVGDNWYDDGSEVTASVTSPADETDGTRYRCTGWTGTGSVPATGTETSVTFTITEPSAITWNWITQYQLTVATNPPGLEPSPVITPPDLWYDVDTVVTCTAQEVTGYEFSHWTLDDITQGTGVNPIFVTMDEPHTAIAHYKEEVTYTIHLESGEDTDSTTNLGTITFDGSTYSLPTDVSKAAGSYPARYNPASGYVFDHWERTGGVSVSAANDNPTTVTVSGDGTLRAVYVSSPPPPVGGFEAPFHTLVMLAPWILLALAAFAAIVVARRKRKH